MVAVRQFDRGVRLTVIPPDGPGILVNPIVPVGRGVSVPQLRVQFRVSRSLDVHPGRAQISVTNLGALSLGAIEGAVGRVGDPASLSTASALRSIDAALAPGPQIVTVADAGHAYTLLEAGYSGVLGKVFEGAASSINSTWSGTDRVTTIRADDGALETSTARVHQSFEPGTPLTAILTIIAKALSMTVAPTPALAALSGYVAEGGDVLYGYARDALVELLSPLQLEQEFWIDDSTIWIVNKGQPLPLPPLLVSSVPADGASRMIGEPQGIEGGGVRVSMLLTSALRIGQTVTLVSGRLAGVYRCEALMHRGDNWGGSAMLSSAILRQPGAV